MSYNGDIVLDADSDIMEYMYFDTRYRKYMDAAFREQFERLVIALMKWLQSVSDIGVSQYFWPQTPSRPLAVCDQCSELRDARLLVRRTWRNGREIQCETNYDSRARLQNRDITRVDISVIFGSQSGVLCVRNDVGFEHVLDRAYSRSISDYYAAGDERLRWVANSTGRGISCAVVEIRYWAENDANVAGMFVARTFPGGTRWDSLIAYPPVAVSQDRDYRVWKHRGANRPPLTLWVDAPNAVCHGIAGMAK